MEEKFHHRLKAKMKEKGLTQRALSKLTDISEPAISKYLSGSRIPHLEIVGKFANALGCSADYLLGCEQNKGSHYQQIEDAIKEHKAYLSAEERMSLIMHLSEK